VALNNNYNPYNPLGTSALANLRIANTASGAGRNNISPDVGRYPGIYTGPTTVYDYTGGNAYVNPTAEALMNQSVVKYPNNNTAGNGQGANKYAPSGATTPTPLYPTPPDPTPNYTMPTVPSLSWEEAQARAKGMFQPQYELARMRSEKQFADQRARLPGLLNARGYLYGGKREAGENNLTQDQAMTLNQLDTDFAAKEASAASSIYSNEQAAANTLLSQLITQKNNENQAAWNTWNTKYNAAFQGAQGDKNRTILKNTAMSKWIDYFLGNE